MRWCPAAAVLALTAALQAQNPAPTATPRPRALTAADIRVLPFAREWQEREFKRTDRDVPDELRAVLVGDRIHLSGKKKTGATPLVGEKSVGHVGKLVLLPLGDRSGTLTVKFATVEAARYYYLVLELADGSLNSKDVKLAPDTNYEWSARTEGGQTTLRVAVAGGAEVASSTAPSATVKGLGFASTLRAQGSEVDMTIVFK